MPDEDPHHGTAKPLRSIISGDGHELVAFLLLPLLQDQVGGRQPSGCGPSPWRRRSRRGGGRRRRRWICFSALRMIFSVVTPLFQSQSVTDQRIGM